MLFEHTDLVQLFAACSVDASLETQRLLIETARTVCAAVGYLLTCKVPAADRGAVRLPRQPAASDCCGCAGHRGDVWHWWRCARGHGVGTGIVLLWRGSYAVRTQLSRDLVGSLFIASAGNYARLGAAGAVPCAAALLNSPDSAVQLLAGRAVASLADNRTCRWRCGRERESDCSCSVAAFCRELGAAGCVARALELTRGDHTAVRHEAATALLYLALDGARAVGCVRAHGLTERRCEPRGDGSAGWIAIRTSRIYGPAATTGTWRTYSHAGG
jgi:hypothetical protein